MKFLSSNALSTSKKLICFSSGKGGVGKTMTSIMCSMHMAKMGMKVLLIDGDLGLSSVAVVLNLSAKYNIDDVLSGRSSLMDTLVSGPFGVKIASSGSGLLNLQHLTELQQTMLLEELRPLENQFDRIVIDAGAGIGSNVHFLNTLSNFPIIVTTPEPHAILDAYALIKTLSQTRHDAFRAGLIVNFARSKDEAISVFHRLSQACQNYLDMDLILLGSIPFEKSVSDVVIARQLQDEVFLKSPVAQSWFQVSHAIQSSIDRFSSEGVSLGKRVKHEGVIHY